MIRRLASLLIRCLGLIVIVGMIGLGVFLYQDNKRSEAFTAELEILAKQEPAVVSPDFGGKNADEGARAADVKGIRSIYDTHNEAWCDGDGEAYASVFTADADFIAFDGTHTIGRAEFAASHQELFDRYLQHTCLQGAIERIKFLGADTAVAYIRSGTRFDGGELVRRPSIQTYVAVRQDGRWRFASFHNGRIDPVQERSVLRLAWLGVKTWLLRR
jgi:uncharacterized protein (TIGR02246 family)